MKKLIFCFMAIVYLLCACVSKEKDISNLTQPEEKNTSNQFFSKNNLESLKFKGHFLFTDEGIIEKDVKIHVNEIVKLKLGTLYELKIEPVEDVPKERLNLGWFFEEMEKIYKIVPTEENKNCLKMKGEIPAGSLIVCQEKEIVDSLSKYQKGEHQNLSIDGDEREYHFYNDKVNTGYFESYIWKKNIGLKFYKSGYGAEGNLVELKLLEQ